VGYPFGVYNWLDTDYPGYAGAVPYYDTSVDQPGYPATGDDAQSPDQDQPPEDNPRYSELPHPPPVTTLANEDAVTLIFKDGRPPEQIHNYALTRTTLYVRDQHHRDIPVDQLDLAATAKVNHDAGVDFQLPATTR
jgi:hypothetical protein